MDRESRRKLHIRVPLKRRLKIKIILTTMDKVSTLNVNGPSVVYVLPNDEKFIIKVRTFLIESLLRVNSLDSLDLIDRVSYLHTKDLPYSGEGCFTLEERARLLNKNIGTVVFRRDRGCFHLTPPIIYNLQENYCRYQEPLFEYLILKEVYRNPTVQHIQRLAHNGYIHLLEIKDNHASFTISSMYVRKVALDTLDIEII